MNRMVGEKVAIVTAKPQTTRTRITGILTLGAVQYVFLDTPGIHRPRTRLGERMAKATADSVAEVDAVVMLFEPYGELTEAEQALVEDIRVKKVPALNCWTHCCLSRWKALTISRTTPTPTCRKRLSWRRCCGKRCC